MLLFMSQYITVNYLEVQYLMHFDFTQETKKINETELKSHLLLFYDKMVKRKARLFLLNVQNSEITQDFIKWFDDVILPLIKSVKATKIAWVGVSSELDSKLENKMEQRKFKNNADAMQWLLQNAERKKLSFENGNKPPNHHHH